MNLNINDKVVFRWLGHERIGHIIDIVSDTDKKATLYKIKAHGIIYTVGLGKETKVGKILKDETEKYQQGNYTVMNKKQDTPLDMKMEELVNLFEEIKHLHNTSHGVELRKKIVEMKNKLTDYRKLTLK